MVPADLPPLAPPGAVALRAGPLRAVLDRGALRWIRWGDREVLRGIYVAVRAPGWLTVPGSIEGLMIDAGEVWFHVRFRARHRGHGAAFDWDARIDGGTDGTLRFEMDGVARSTFARNRIGVCVLHPVDGCAGRPCAVETVDGRRLSGAFPRLVAPQQPFLTVRALRHEVAPGVEAEVRFEGEVFETEDQRNWGDASFKTYSTPLALPYPVEVPEGTRIRQVVSVRLVGPAATVSAPGGPDPARAEGAADEGVAVAVDLEQAGPLPRVGTAIPAGAPVPGEGAARLLRSFALAHLRVDLHVADEVVTETLARANDWSRALEVPLEVALFLSAPPETDLDTVAVAATAVRPRVASWLVFDRETRATPDGLAATARRVLSGLDPGARIAGGTDGWFVELNRHRPAAAELDRVSFALSPQVHLVDDATVVENLDSLAWIAESVRAFGAGRPLGISPVTLRPRSDPSPFDPRHHTGFDACWTTGLLAAAAAAGFESLTLFEATGAQGLVDGEAKGPLAGVLGEVSRAAGEAAVLATRSSSPAVRALALLAAGSIRVLLANLGSREERVTVSLNGRPTDAPRVWRAVSLAPLAVACVSFDAEETTPVSRDSQDSR